MIVLYFSGLAVVFAEDPDDIAVANSNPPRPSSFLVFFFICLFCVFRGVGAALP